MEQETTFEPELTLFTCIYCGYMAADTAGALRIEYPPNAKLVRFPCTGKLDVRYILEAFEKGADGVIVVACPIGNCHHIHGNIQATRRVQHAKKLLDEVGLGGDRLEIFYMSGGQGGTFANAVKTMVERIKKLGPNPLKNGTGPRS
ncbi:MAG TPA: hydrogenase iron-sulfur subunit [Chloroflexi bacterium]|nr:hydrogenase iron-sulfur subunit [Chloroflexota bacterium]